MLALESGIGKCEIPECVEGLRPSQHIKVIVNVEEIQSITTSIDLDNRSIFPKLL